MHTSSSLRLRMRASYVALFTHSIRTEQTTLCFALDTKYCRINKISQFFHTNNNSYLQMSVGEWASAKLCETFPSSFQWCMQPVGLSNSHVWHFRGQNSYVKQEITYYTLGTDELVHARQQRTPRQYTHTHTAWAKRLSHMCVGAVVRCLV